MKNVMRKTLTGGWTKYEFEQVCKHYFVKNYSDGDIYVSFDENDEEDASCKISSGVGEEIATTYREYDRNEDYTDTIYVKGTGEVEVQQLDI